MMLKKISLIASLLFFLLGTNALANSQLESYPPKSGEVITHSLKFPFASKSYTSLKIIAEKTASKNQEQIKKKDEPSIKDFVVPGFVGLILIIGLGYYWLIYRRKHV